MSKCCCTNGDILRHITRNLSNLGRLCSSAHRLPFLKRHSSVWILIHVLHVPIKVGQLTSNANDLSKRCGPSRSVVSNVTALAGFVYPESLSSYDARSYSCAAKIWGGYHPVALEPIVYSIPQFVLVACINITCRPVQKTGRHLTRGNQVFDQICSN